MRGEVRGGRGKGREGVRKREELGRGGRGKVPDITLTSSPRGPAIRKKEKKKRRKERTSE